MIIIWIWLWNFFHFQEKRVPVTVHICDDIHGDDKSTYYVVKKHRHARI